MSYYSYTPLTPVQRAIANKVVSRLKLYNAVSKGRRWARSIHYAPPMQYYSRGRFRRFPGGLGYSRAANRYKANLKRRYFKR